MTHGTGRYNVQASIAAWLAGQIVTYAPPLVSPQRLNLAHPEQPIDPPEWSLHFLGEDQNEMFSGGVVGDGAHGARQYGMAEVGCWVTRKITTWRGQLAQMQDSVTKALAAVYGTGASIPVYDFYTNANTPAALAFKINITSWEVRNPPVDPNPDIERKRIMIHYNWVERV